MGIFSTDYGSFLSLVGECRVNCQTEPHDHALGLGSLHLRRYVKVAYGCMVDTVIYTTH